MYILDLLDWLEKSKQNHSYQRLFSVISLETRDFPSKKKPNGDTFCNFKWLMLTNHVVESY